MPPKKSTTTKRRKKPVKYSHLKAKKLCKLVAAGQLVEEIVKQDPDSWPTSSTIYSSWPNTHPEFRDMLDEAYESWLMAKMYEIDMLSKTPINKLESVLDIDFAGDFKSGAEYKKTRLASLHFILARIAPVLAKRFTNRSQLDVSGDIKPSIIIANYAQLPDKIPKPDAIEKGTTIEIGPDGDIH